ncbi:MAG TPA: acetyl-CoA acetyltransferase, partial [Alphaproteobacteria bacterium]|nr:acetyl-CoA acetyltransferase [Alphaproteobacteria bacterium]
LSPMGLMERVARLAAEDAGAGEALLRALDTIVVLRSFSDTSPRFTCPFGRYTNPPKSLAARLGADAAKRLVYTHPGGNMPQWSVNRLFEMVTRGEVGAALVTGAEALSTQKRAQRAGIALGWSEDPGGAPEQWGVDRRGWFDVEAAHRMGAAIYMYPLFENAIRAHRGRTIAEHQQAMGRLFARFAAVAAENPLADRRQGFSAEALATVRPDNPYIGFPYTRLMNANAFIDQGAALILTSAAKARALGIPEDRWVYLHGCADAHDHWYVSDRKDFHSSPAIRTVREQAFAMAGCELSEIGAIDLYSCFPSAVEIGCQEIGLAEDDPRGLTVTGGLPYFGGPGNNYVTHSIAQMMSVVRARPGLKGLVTANGNYVTKHSAGIYSTEPPARSFAPVDPAIYQAAIDADRGPGSVAMAEGAATVETYTVMHDREGPAFGIVVGRLPDGRRFVANTPEDPGLLAEMEQRDYVGAAGRVVNDGSRNTFNPG